VKRFLTTVAVAALSLTALAATPASAASILVNGGFEDIGSATPEGWGGLTYYAGGPLTLPGWMVEDGSVDLTSTTSVWGPASEGNYSLDINGWSAGRISQSFDTVFGQTYQVSFAYSRNVAGAPDPALATVSVGGHSLDVSAPDTAIFGSGHDMHWLTDGFSFVGNGSPTTLTLAAVTQGNGGVFFDNVSVEAIGAAIQQSVPEPATWSMMIGGFGLAGAMFRRRRALAAI
jgi:choice-of-anchor C domain-containing protein